MIMKLKKIITTCKLTGTSKNIKSVNLIYERNLEMFHLKQNFLGKLRYVDFFNAIIKWSR